MVKYKHSKKTTLIICLLLGTLAPALQAAQPKTDKAQALQTWFEAAITGEVKLLKELRNDYNLNVDVRDEDGYTALIKSSEKGHLDCLKYLIQQGADINATNEWGNSALIWSARQGHLDCVKYLLQQGAHINTQNGIGYNSLHFSAQEGRVDVVKYLVEEGADIHDKNKSGYTALILSARFGNLATVKCLVENGADIHAKDKHGNTALQWAQKEGKQEVVRYIKEWYEMAIFGYWREDADKNCKLVKDVVSIIFCYGDTEI